MCASLGSTLVAEPKLAVAYGEELLSYDFGEGHPMRSERVEVFFRRIREAGLLGDPKVKAIRPRAATLEELLLFHRPSYVRRVREQSETGVGLLDDEDTPAFKGVFEAASYVVGTTLECLKESLSGGIYAFNPMGGLHHARRDRAAGFCVFNDVCVAIEYSRKRAGLRRILYVDLDAHHGDGVMYEYYHDKDVRILDFHEDGRHLYPGTGFEHETGGSGAEGSKFNVVLQPGSTDRQFRDGLARAARFLSESDPELVILQAGADCMAGDPIADLSLSEGAHRLATRVLREIADQCAGGRLIALGGGGYNPTNTSSAWLSVLNALLA